MTITLAVRVAPGDADVLAATVEHHRREGVDRIVVIDPARDAGVRSAMQPLLGFPGVELRDAWTPDDDGWVLDAQGGEFWAATDPGTRLADALAAFPRSVARIDVPVVRLSGPAAQSGTGLARLVLRDPRPAEELRALGAWADPVTRTARRPGPDEPAEQDAVEVLRLDARSLDQQRARSGEDGLVTAGYLASALVEPAPGEGAGAARDDRLAGLPGAADRPLDDAEALTQDALRAAVRAARTAAEERDRAAGRADDAERALGTLRSRLLVRAADRSARLGRSAARRLRDAGSVVADRREDHRARREEEQRAQAVRDLLEHPMEPVSVRGEPGADAVPIVMCLWNRPARLPSIVRMLADQRTERPLRLILWNNKEENLPQYRRQLIDARLGSLASIELYASPRNLGGVARFVVARWLWREGVRGPFLMLDDDQEVGDTFVESLLSEFEPRTISAWWGFANHGSHWQRSEVAPGGDLDYAGTGGTVADLELVADPGFFELPARYLMLEDQWMTAYAKRHGWRVRKSAAAIDQVMAEETGNQYHALRALKDEFYALLHADEGR